MKNFVALSVVFALFFVSANPLFAGEITANSGQAVPYITTDEDSIEYLVGAIVQSVVESLGDISGSEEKQVEESSESNYLNYARDLAETLSQLTPSEQNTVWYGSS